MLRAILNHSDKLLAAGRLTRRRRSPSTASSRPAASAWSSGSILACNATEALLALGRWDQAEQLSREGLETSPSGPAYVALPLARAALELGLGDLDAAQARLQAVRRLLPDRFPRPKTPGRCLVGWPSWRCGAATPTRPSSWSTRRCPRWRPTPPRRADLRPRRAYRGRHCRAGQGPSPPPAGPDDHTATTLLDRLDRAATGRAGAGLPELAAWYATARAEQTRQQGPSDPAAWAAAAAAWERLGQPYRTAYAGFRHAEALLATGGDRDTAAAVLRRAAEVTGRLGARPLDGEVRALARRARLDLAHPPTARPRHRPPERPRSWSSWA